MKRNVFLDEELESRFNRDGYVTLNLLNDEKLKDLFDLLHELKSSARQDNVNVQSSYELSFFNRDAEYRANVLKKVYGFFKPLLDPILDHYEPLIVNLFNKKPGTGEVPIHQNWSFVDESKFTSVSVWIPLCDVSRKNGTLEVVPRTHNTMTPFRSPSIPWVFTGLEKVLKKKYMKPLELKVGQIAILDDAILHYSSDNNSDADRGTIQLIMIPEDSTPIHYHWKDKGKNELDVYKVNKDFFVSFDMNKPPEGVPLMGSVPFKFTPIKKERELVKRIS